MVAYQSGSFLVTSRPSPSSTTTSRNEPTAYQSNDLAAIAGIVIGITAAVTFFVFLCCAIYRRRIQADIASINQYTPYASDIPSVRSFHSLDGQYLSTGQPGVIEIVRPPLRLHHDTNASPAQQFPQPVITSDNQTPLPRDSFGKETLSTAENNPHGDPVRVALQDEDSTYVRQPTDSAMNSDKIYE